MGNLSQMDISVKNMEIAGNRGSERIEKAEKEKKIKQFLRSDFETTDLSLFVRTSEEDLTTWDRRKIVEALIRETYVDTDTADLISKEVEHQIMSSRISVITAPLIREMVDAKLIEHGLERGRGPSARR